MGSMKAKSGGTHRYSPVSCPHPIAMECWAWGRGAGSDGSSVWAELLLPVLSALLRAAVVTGASSDLPHQCSCCLVFLCWNRERGGKLLLPPAPVLEQRNEGKGGVLQIQGCFWD